MWKVHQADSGQFVQDQTAHSEGHGQKWQCYNVRHVGPSHDLYCVWQRWRFDLLRRQARVELQTGHSARGTLSGSSLDTCLNGFIWWIYPESDIRPRAWKMGSFVDCLERGVSPIIYSLYCSFNGTNACCGNVLWLWVKCDCIHTAWSHLNEFKGHWLCLKLQTTWLVLHCSLSKHPFVIFMA